MDPKQMVDHHIASGAAVTVAGIRQPKAMSDQFGVIDVAEDGRRIKAFREKPTEVEGLPDAPDEIFASMGNYVFTTRALCEAVSRDAQDPDSKHDMGGNIIPMLVERGEANVYDFRDNEVPGSTERDRGYWRDVGTLDSFYDAHMDLIATLPVFNLYNMQWPIFTDYGNWPPAKFVHGYDDRQGRAIDRKSTRLNSSHANISYAVFCLKKKKKQHKFSNPRLTPGTYGSARSNRLEYLRSVFYAR